MTSDQSDARHADRRVPARTTSVSVGEPRSIQPHRKRRPRYIGIGIGERASYFAEGLALLEQGRDEIERAFSINPLDGLRAVLNHYRRGPYSGPRTPLAAGVMGYLAYDLKDVLEDLPRTSVDRWQLPHLCVYAPSMFLVHDRQIHQTHLHEIVRRQGCPQQAPEGGDRIAALWEAPLPDESFTVDHDGLQSNFDRPAYEAAVQRIRDYIAAGDVYQVNLSQRFETRFQGSSFGFFRALYQKNPAPFFAFMNAGDHHLVSTSPERFLRLDGRHVETRPIKGTRPRRSDPREDQRMRADLETSTKDDAELSMIVDLLRNDIGRVCRGGFSGQMIFMR